MSKTDNEFPARPVSVLKHDKVFENSAWDVFSDHVRSRDGVNITDYLVVAPKERRTDSVSGVAVLPVCDKQIVLLRNYRHPMRDYFWEVPRGFVESGEAIPNAAVRELEEEAGLICAMQDLEFLGNVAPEPSTIDGKGAVFIAHECRPSDRFKDINELGLGKPHAMPIDDVVRLLNGGKIEDAITTIAILRFLSNHSTDTRYQLKT